MGKKIFDKKFIIIHVILLIIVLAAGFLVVKNMKFYKCPSVDDEWVRGKEDDMWINCMPSEVMSKYCEWEYQQWIKENCPGISIGG